MTQQFAGMPPTPACVTPGVPRNLTATGGRKSVEFEWSPAAGDPPTGGCRIYYDQAGKRQLIANVNASTPSYTDRGLRRITQYCYVLTAWNDCDSSGTYEVNADTEGDPTDVTCATTR